MFHGRVTQLPGTELWPAVSIKVVNKTRKHFFPGIFMAHACFPNVSQFAIRKTLSPVSVFFSTMQIFLCPAIRQGILTKIGACEKLQKLCERERTSTYLNFANNSSKGQILRAISNGMRPFDTPTMGGFDPSPLV